MLLALEQVLAQVPEEAEVLPLAVVALALPLVGEVVALPLFSLRKLKALKHKLRTKPHKMYISFLFLVS